MPKLAAFLAALAALVAPAAAHAGDVTMRVRDISLTSRGLAAVRPQTHFNMLAAHWIGAGVVEYRTKRLHGGWTQWAAADSDNTSGAWHDGNLDWTGASSSVQFRTRGIVRQLRSYAVWSQVTIAPSRRLSAAGAPAIVSRQGWGADEEIVRGKPLIAPVLKLAVVHHTAGTNNYTRAQAAAIVRGIEVYHVQGNGWNDIGYNFLVDRFGTVYEGRAGGIERNVIGAHAEGFNTGTVGVALIGNYSKAIPPEAQQDGLVGLLAWRLDLAHIDPLAKVAYTSGGNLKFKAGKIVTLNAISGHRDTGPSECPGADAYALLPAIAKRVDATGLPKLYAPAAVGVLGGPVTFRARLSRALPWSVTVTDKLGKKVAGGSGTGALVSWTWASPAVGTGRYAWTIEAPDILAASGTLGAGKVAPPAGAPALSLTNLAAAPAVVAPNPAATSTVTFSLGAPAQVTAELLDAANAQVATLLDEQRPAGSNSFSWDASAVPDGRYTLVVAATMGTRRIAESVAVAVDRSLTGLAASAPVISPDGDGVDDSVALTFTLTQDVPVRFDLQRSGTVVATLFSGQLGVGAHTLAWDGTANGAVVPAGVYTIVATVTDALGDVSLQLPLTVTAAATSTFP